MHSQTHERAFGPDDIEVVAPELKGLIRCQHPVDEEVVVVPLRGGWQLDKWVSRRIRPVEEWQIAARDIHRPDQAKLLAEPVCVRGVSPASRFVPDGSVTGNCKQGI